MRSPEQIREANMKWFGATAARKIANKHDEKLKKILRMIKVRSKAGFDTLNVKGYISSIKIVLEALGYKVECISPPLYVSASGYYYDYKLQNNYYKISW